MPIYTIDSMEKKLNVNLGLPIAYDGAVLTAIRATIIPFSLLFEYTIESMVFGSWKMIPVSVRAKLAKGSWAGYLAVHKALIGKSTVLHPSLSHEYAALTTVMWGARLLPMTLNRMRFGLNQIGEPNHTHTHRYYDIQAQNAADGSFEQVFVCVHGSFRSLLCSLFLFLSRIIFLIHTWVWPECNFPPNSSIRKEAIHTKDGSVRGIYVHSQQNMGDSANRKVLFWLYGGAFLSGDCQGNVGLAESVAEAANCDVFLAEYTLCPEGSIVDAVRDVQNCYEWLLDDSGRVTSGSQVSVLGISSGGGAALDLIQKMSAKAAKYQPRCAVLISPWVHFDWENLFPSLQVSRRRVVFERAGEQDRARQAASE